MKKRGKVTALSQYFIDYVRIERLERDMSAPELSKEIAPFDGSSLVGQIEYEYSDAKYTSTTLKKALNHFGKTMQDILPEDLLDNDKLLEKTKILILKKMSIRAALNSLLEEGFFKEPKLRSEITAYYNSFLSEENHKKDSDFSAQLEDLYNEGKLLKIQGDKGQNKEDKLIRFIRNPDFKED